MQNEPTVKIYPNLESLNLIETDAAKKIEQILKL